MKNHFRYGFLFFILFMCVHGKIFAANDHPDTVNVGIYVTSVHDVDFREKEFSINLWLWLKYKRPEFDFMKNLEIPMAKTFEKSYTIIDTLEDGRIYMLMKLQCIMKGTWKITDFPFDRQTLRFAIENSMFDASELVFSADTSGEHYGKYFLMAWEKDSFNIKTEIKEYDTAFGDPEYTKPFSEYAAYKVSIIVHRESWELFLKLFMGMYISFLISLVCFYIHPDNMDSKLALTVGSLFAVIGNKYIIDSTLPESNTFTLVDSLHGITMFYIFLVMASSVYTLNLIKSNKLEKAKNHNRIIGWVLLFAYVFFNVWLIWKATNGEVS
jgi:hypothetical protein